MVKTRTTAMPARPGRARQFVVEISRDAGKTWEYATTVSNSPRAAAKLAQQLAAVGR